MHARQPLPAASRCTRCSNARLSAAAAGRRRRAALVRVSSSGDGSSGSGAGGEAPSSSAPAAGAVQQPQQQQQQQQQRAARRARRPRLSPAADGAPPLRFEEVAAAAAARGLFLTRTTLGPFYRIACREGGKEGRVLGVTTGFVAPLFGLVHCDTLQIFTRGLKGDEGERLRGGSGLSVGLLLGGAAFSHAWAAGCKKAEILAINDDDSWHERLVRYYSFFGFEPVCSVGGNGLSDLPHMLVWGGEGTRMDADVAVMLARWGPAIRRQLRSSGSKGGGGGGGAGGSDGGGGGVESADDCSSAAAGR